MMVVLGSVRNYVRYPISIRMPEIRWLISILWQLLLYTLYNAFMQLTSRLRQWSSGAYVFSIDMRDFAYGTLPVDASEALP